MSWSEFPVVGDTKVDRAVVWIRPESMFPSFLDKLNGNQLNVAKLDSEVEEFLDILESASENLSALWVPLWVRSDFVRGLGIGEYKKGGTNWALQRINNSLNTLNDKNWNNLHPEHLKLILNGYLQYRDGLIFRNIILEVFKKYKYILLDQ